MGIIANDMRTLYRHHEGKTCEHVYSETGSARMLANRFLNATTPPHEPTIIVRYLGREICRSFRLLLDGLALVELTEVLDCLELHADLVLLEVQALVFLQKLELVLVVPLFV